MTTSLRLTAPVIGGPVLVGNQVVVGVARSSAPSGNGLVTSLAAAREFLNQAKSGLAATPAIDSVPPTWPRRAVSGEALAEGRSRTRDDILRRFSMDHGDYRVMALTPQNLAWRQGEVRKAREASPFSTTADYCAASERCDIMEAWASWRDYVNERRAVVIVLVSPKVADQPKFGAYQRAPEFRRGNVGALAMVRDGQSAQPIESARVYTVVNPQTLPENQRYYSAIYVYSAADFAGARRIDLTVVGEGGGGQATFQLRNEIIQAVTADVGSYVTRP
jgi:hypothetical protein